MKAFLIGYTIVFFCLSAYYSTKFKLCLPEIKSMDISNLGFSLKDVNDSQVANLFFWHTPLINIITACCFFRRVDILHRHLQMQMQMQMPMPMQMQTMPSNVTI